MTNRTQPETPAGGPLGDTGDGHTGVPADKQGISNRPGDRAEDDVDVDVKYDDIASSAADADDDEGAANTGEDDAE